MRGRGYSLGRAVVKGLILRHVDTEGGEAGDISELEGAFRLRDHFMDLMLKTAWPNRFQSQPKSDFSEGTVALKACVKDFDSSAGAPPTVCG
jgi:hypothetical protein